MKFDMSLLIETHDSVPPANDAAKQRLGSKSILDAGCVASWSVVCHLNYVANLEHLLTHKCGSSK